MCACTLRNYSPRLNLLRIENVWKSNIFKDWIIFIFMKWISRGGFLNNVGESVDRLIPVVVIVGIVVLFLFPEPDSNFGWYVLTGVLFVGVVGILFWLRNKNI